MPCPDHAPKPWESSKRAEKTISGSRQQKRSRFILARDKTICHVCGQPGADQADHVIALIHGGADSIANMAAIHANPCHAEKTQREALAGRA
ncbi:MAG: HNH endonuclease [Solirubrobacterales bacterium]